VGPASIASSCGRRLLKTPPSITTSSSYQSKQPLFRHSARLFLHTRVQSSRPTRPLNEMDYNLTVERTGICNLLRSREGSELPAELCLRVLEEVVDADPKSVGVLMCLSKVGSAH